MKKIILAGLAAYRLACAAYGQSRNSRSRARDKKRRFYSDWSPSTNHTGLYS